jgi:hypothetical protein
MEESSAERPNEIPGSCGFLLTIAARSSTPASVHQGKLRVGFDGRSARPEWEVQSLHRDTFLPRPVLPDTAISARLASGSAASSGGTSMILVSVMYPGGPNATFDEAYYLGTHIPLVKVRWTSMGLGAHRSIPSWLSSHFDPCRISNRLRERMGPRSSRIFRNSRTCSRFCRSASRSSRARCPPHWPVRIVQVDSGTCSVEIGAMVRNGISFAGQDDELVRSDQVGPSRILSV